MSSSSRKPKYALVYWNEDRSYTIISTSVIENVECLYNPSMVSLLPFPGHGEEPQDGWPKYPGSVLRLGDKKGYLKNQAVKIIEEFEEQKNKSAKKGTSVTTSKKTISEVNSADGDNMDDEDEEDIFQHPNKRSKKGESSLNYLTEESCGHHAELHELHEENEK